MWNIYDFLPKSTIWKNGEICNFYSEEAWWTIYLSQMINVNTYMLTWTMLRIYTLDRLWEWQFTSVVFLQDKITPILFEKISNSNRGIFYKILDFAIRNSYGLTPLSFWYASTRSGQLLTYGTTRCFRILLYFSDPTLKSPPSARNPGFFYWKIVFRNQNLCPR